MARAKLIKIKVTRDSAALDAIVDALLDENADAAGDALDAALAFSGIIGTTVERFDGAILDELAELLLSLSDRIARRVAERVGT